MLFPSRFLASPAGKWLGFVTAIWVQAISGNNYTFSNYSGALKSLMELSQTQLNNLSVAKDVGKAFGLLSGLASDRLPTSAILIVGALEGLIGYGVQWLVVSQRISPLPYWQVLSIRYLGFMFSYHVICYVVVLLISILLGNLSFYIVKLSISTSYAGDCLYARTFTFI